MKPETTYPAIIGRILARERSEQGFDQAKMAQAVGINRSSWSRIENGEFVPNAVLLHKIANALKKTPSEILTEADKVSEDLKQKGVRVHLEKPAAKSGAKKAGWGLALLGAAALGGLVASALMKDDGSSDESPGRLSHRPDGSGED